MDNAGAATVYQAEPEKVPPLWQRAVPWVLLTVILVAQFLYVHAYYAPALSTPDANGYWAQGSLMTREGQTWYRAESDVQYVGMHWLITEDGRYASRYPPGLPLMIAAVYVTLGPNASVFMDLVFATLSLLGLYLLARRLAGPWWGLAACAVLASNPVFNQHALWNFAHMTVNVFLVWGVYLLVLWSEHRRWWLALGAGFLLGVIPTVRYPEALLALGIAVYLLWDIRKEASTRRQLTFAILGAAMPVVALLIRNQVVFGAFYKTGYALTNEQTGFGWSYFTDHFISYLRAINGDGAGPVFLLGLIGIAAMIGSASRRRLGVLLLLIAVPMTLLYMAYYWGGGGGGGPGGPGGGANSRAGMSGLRFLLPTFFCYALAGTWFLAEVLRGRSVVLRAGAGLALVLLQFAWGVFHNADEFERLHRNKSLLAKVTDELEAKVPHGQLILASRELEDHLDFIRHWPLADLRVVQGGGGFGGFGGRSRGGSEDEPSPMQREKAKQLEEKFAGMSFEERAEALGKELVAFAHGRKVYFVGGADELKSLRGVLRSEDFTVVARVEVPQEPPGPDGAPRPSDPNSMNPNGGPGGFGGPGGRTGGPGGFGGFGGRRGRGGWQGGRGGGGGGGGMMGMGRLLEEKEIVIAEWNGHLGEPEARGGRGDFENDPRGGGFGPGPGGFGPNGGPGPNGPRPLDNDPNAPGPRRPGGNAPQRPPPL